MSQEEIGCCGAYCGTCRAYLMACKGCKVGYRSGERDIGRARCRMKVCCMTRGNATCADCAEYETCLTLEAFFGHAAYKYRKYREALEYIRDRGYAAFLDVADTWSGAYGRYPS